jgi:hypothetical protein
MAKLRYQNPFNDLLAYSTLDQKLLVPLRYWNTIQQAVFEADCLRETQSVTLHCHTNTHTHRERESLREMFIEKDCFRIIEEGALHTCRVRPTALSIGPPES